MWDIPRLESHQALEGSPRNDIPSPHTGLAVGSGLSPVSQDYVRVIPSPGTSLTWDPRVKVSVQAVFWFGVSS